MWGCEGGGGGKGGWRRAVNCDGVGVGGGRGEGCLGECEGV